MNIDFVFENSPKIARRLLNLSNDTKLKINDIETLEELASKNLIEFTLDLPEKQKSSIQFINDCDNRGIICSNNEQEICETLLLTAYYSNTFPICIIYENESEKYLTYFKKLASKLSLSKTYLSDKEQYKDEQIIFIKSKQLLENIDLINLCRTGINISLLSQGTLSKYYESLFSNSSFNPFIEFEKFVIGLVPDYMNTFISNNQEHKHFPGYGWIYAIELHDIFQKMVPHINPRNIFPVQQPDVNKLMRAGFITCHPSKMAQMANISLHLLD